MINALREQISIWYVAIRNLAAIILGIMVLYVGIRMAISSVAEEKARYKKMLGDWVVSLVLLFVLHYIMIFIININDSLEAILSPINYSLQYLWINTMLGALLGVIMAAFTKKEKSIFED